MTTINIDNVDIKVHLDVCGNVYFEHNDVLTQLCVDAHDDPYLDPANYDIIIPEEEAIPEIIRGTITQSDTFNNDMYFVEENGTSFNRIRESFECDDMSDDICFSEDNVYFIFYEKDPKTDFPSRNNGDIPALYDTFIYDDVSEEKAEMILSAKINTENNIYRTIIYRSGKFFFRPIGSHIERCYKLAIENNSIVCCKI